MMQPAAQMPVPPPRAQGEDGVASLWRTLGRAAPTAQDGLLRREFSRRGASEAGAAGRLVHSRATALGDTVKKSA